MVSTVITAICFYMSKCFLTRVLYGINQGRKTKGLGLELYNQPFALWRSQPIRRFGRQSSGNVAMVRIPRQ